MSFSMRIETEAQAAASRSNGKASPWGHPWKQPGVFLVTITPKQAEQILANHNPKNRRLCRKRSDVLANSIKAGHWMVNGETIAFDKNGVLQDGQHRLDAIVRSGKPIQIYVAFGQRTDAHTTRDRGKRRSAADDLAIAGESYCNGLAATIVISKNFLDGERTKSVIYNSFDSRTIAEFLEANGELRDSVVYASKVHKLVPSTPRIVAACYFLFGRKSTVDRDNFFEGLSTGIGLANGSPILALRNRLFLDLRRSKGEIPGVRREASSSTSFEVFQLFIRAWNHFRAGSTITKLQVAYVDRADSRVLASLPEIQ
jgi:hypothetical protein